MIKPDMDTLSDIGVVMNTHLTHTHRSELVASIIEFTALVFFLAVLSQFPHIADIRHATIILGLIGFAACIVGGVAPIHRAKGWTSNEAAFGIVLGVIAMLLVGHACFGYCLPLIDSDQSAFMALAGVIAAKVLIIDIPWDRNG